MSISLHQPLIEARHISVSFKLPGKEIQAVRDLNFSIAERETLGLVGESGSGKSVSGKVLLGLLESPGFLARGEVVLKGQQIFSASGLGKNDYRGSQVGLIFQDPGSAFDSLFTVGDQIQEALRRHQALGSRQARRKALQWLEQAGFDNADAIYKSYPFQLSGGMKQLAYAAMVMALEPSVIVADEPTSSLDMISQAQIMDLISKVQQKTGCGLLFISHDLGLVQSIADRIMVMYAGQIVEEGPAAELMSFPLHPYTAMLKASSLFSEQRGCLPEYEDRAGDSMVHEHYGNEGCAFSSRCNCRATACLSGVPPMINNGWHRVSCCQPGPGSFGKGEAFA